MIQTINLAVYSSYYFPSSPNNFAELTTNDFAPDIWIEMAGFSIYIEAYIPGRGGLGLKGAGVGYPTNENIKNNH